jgi:hypothetical protein
MDAHGKAWSLLTGRTRIGAAHELLAPWSTVDNIRLDPPQCKC